jgi:hypothetical protein
MPLGAFAVISGFFATIHKCGTNGEGMYAFSADSKWKDKAHTVAVYQPSETRITGGHTGTVTGALHRMSHRHIISQPTCTLCRGGYINGPPECLYPQFSTHKKNPVRWQGSFAFTGEWSTLRKKNDFARFQHLFSFFRQPNGWASLTIYNGKCP